MATYYPIYGHVLPEPMLLKHEGRCALSFNNFQKVFISMHGKLFVLQQRFRIHTRLISCDFLTISAHDCCFVFVALSPWRLHITRLMDWVPHGIPGGPCLVWICSPLHSLPPASNPRTVYLDDVYIGPAVAERDREKGFVRQTHFHARIGSCPCRDK